MITLKNISKDYIIFASEATKIKVLIPKEMLKYKVIDFRFLGK
tara:strand:- start:11 stop:139 length:129 start_codon:yes stop_codon:yes gene_type:complete